MERNQEHFYSYAQSSDDESLMCNINFGGGESDDTDDDDNDDDDDYSDDEEEEEFTDNTDHDNLSEEDSTSEKFGYLVDKSSLSAEVNNNSDDSNSSLKPTLLNGTIELVNGIDDEVEGKLSNGTTEHEDKHNDKLLQDKRLADLRAQVSRHLNVTCKIY